jgi:hypothetical protein
MIRMPAAVKTASNASVYLASRSGGGLRLTGEGGLLGKLTKMVVEGALKGELDDHLGAAHSGKCHAKPSSAFHPYCPHELQCGPCSGESAGPIASRASSQEAGRDCNFNGVTPEMEETRGSRRPGHLAAGRGTGSCGRPAAGRQARAFPAAGPGIPAVTTGRVVLAVVTISAGPLDRAWAQSGSPAEASSPRERALRQNPAGELIVSAAKMNASVALPRDTDDAAGTVYRDPRVDGRCAGRDAPHRGN